MRDREEKTVSKASVRSVAARPALRAVVGNAVLAALGAALALASARPVRAQQPAAPSAPDAQAGGAVPGAGPQIVAGTVRGAGRTVVVGAKVVVTPVAVAGGPATGVGRGTNTDEDGHFRVPGVPAGRVTITVHRIGFAPLTIDTLTSALPRLDVTLVPVAQKLAAVVVNARRHANYTGPLAAFNRRRDLGFGRFITAADIDSRHPMLVSDMLRMVPGMSVLSSGPLNRLRLRGGTCDPLVWLDGSPAMSGYLDVDAFDPTSLAGIEIYSGVATVPVELRGTRGEEACGVIALWSRLPEPRPRNSGRTYTAADLERLVEAATVYTAEQVDRPARLDSTATLAVTYPDSLRNTHTSGEATVEFVVDTTGAVELGTVGLVAASNPRFGDAARLAAVDARFIPAERAGRTVRQLVQLPLRWDGGR